MKLCIPVSLKRILLSLNLDKSIIYEEKFDKKLYPNDKQCRF